ncbi:hypothetical protein K469DRAFT_225891 [Zopfia rhizophila CBS 207.26]|uniref:Uncharacterized protein n=1 Tax=Zopfia rhizophila CBS 207.26 TaxID=1314779 RepID=A0A6A6DX74_9PEZI|nr:hypothetical protein K469DRAFT_225891 [Zopfia rhizophila CBS 207.26]
MWLPSNVSSGFLINKITHLASIRKMLDELVAENEAEARQSVSHDSFGICPKWTAADRQTPQDWFPPSSNVRLLFPISNLSLPSNFLEAGQKLRIHIAPHTAPPTTTCAKKRMRTAVACQSLISVTSPRLDILTPIPEISALSFLGQSVQRGIVGDWWTRDLVIFTFIQPPS